MSNNIFVLVDFSKDIGNGHLNRVNSLLQNLETNELEIQKIIINNENKNNLLKTISINSFEKSSLQLLLIDSFILNDKTIIFLSKFFKNVLIIDDWIGRKLNGNNIYILDWTALADRSPIHSNQKKLERFFGIEYCPIKIEKNFSKTNDFLIYLGSNIKINIYIEIIKNLLKEYPKKNIIVINKNIKEIKKVFPKNQNLSFFDFQNENNFRKYLRSTEYFISIGGWSCYQAIAAGCCPLLISLGDSNTYFDCYGIIFAGYGEAFGYIDEQGNLKITKKELNLKNNTYSRHDIGKKLKILNKLLK